MRFMMSRISRRNLLFRAGGSVIGTAVAGSGVARERESSGGLAMLIEAHKAAYTAFIESIRKPNRARNDHAESSRVEERALMAVLQFRAIDEADRRAKAEYLLEVEARGELDLRQHIQAVLRSMI